MSKILYKRLNKNFTENKISAKNQNIVVKKAPIFIALDTSDLNQAIAIANDVKSFVIGYPLNMNNKKNEMTELVDQFKADLIKMNFKVYLQDERLSSESAKKIIHQQNIKTGENKEKIDLIASTIILQSFLDKGAA